MCSWIVCRNEGLNGRDELLDAGKADTPQGLSCEDAEPDFNLVQPGRVGGSEVEVNVRVAVSPLFVVDFMTAVVVENDVKFLVRMRCDKLVHKIQKFGPAFTLIVACVNMASSDIESGK